MEFLKVVGRVPGGGLETPFDEIKKYKSWAWGSDPASQPKITFKLQNPDKICEICINSSLCSTNSNPISKMGIRVRITNSYKLLVNTEVFDNDSSGKPFKSFNTDSISPDLQTDRPFSIFSVNHFTDPNEDPMFSEYKPLGDVWFLNDEFDIGLNTNIDKCRPRDEDLEYDGPLFDIVTGKQGEHKATELRINSKDMEAVEQLAVAANGVDNGHIYTMLVSGPDLKPPISYTHKASVNKRDGINKGYETINIWKPVAAPGYVALGYVLDLRPAADATDTDNSTSHPMPSRNRIYTVPISALSELKIFSESDIYSNLNLYTPNRSNMITEPGLPNRITSSYDLPADFAFQPIPESFPNEPIHVCQSNTLNTPETKVEGDSSANHDKKYSIMRVYEEDEFND